MKSFKRGAFLLVVLSLIAVANICIGATRILNVTVEGQGEVNRNPLLAIYPNGATVTLKAIPIDGWMFSTWSGDATGIENPLNLLMDADKSVVAKFELIPVYPLSVAVVGAGTVEPSEGMYRSNSLVILTATPSNGWVFVRWSGDDDSTANPLAVTMSRPTTFFATFAELPHIVEEPQSVNANAGENVSFEVTAAGAAPLSYEWSFDGNVLSGETNRILTISNAQPSQAGGYSVRVFNAYGSVTSAVASLILMDSCVGSNLVTVCDEASLRSAVSIGGVVRFCCNGTIALSNSIDVATDVILDASDHDVVISGNGEVRLFSVRTNVSFSVTNLTFANGRHQGRNGTVAGTIITPAENGEGGAILNDGGVVNLVSCLLSNNVASGGSGAFGLGSPSMPEPISHAGWARGGGICNLGGVVRLHSVVAVSNEVVGGLGALTPGDTNGLSMGGFLSSDGGKVMVTDSRFHGNSATGNPGGEGLGGPGPGAGGAMGGALYLANSELVAEDSRFVGNSAIGERVEFAGGNPASADGGAVYLLSGRAYCGGALFASNTAKASDGFRHSGSGSARGGAVFSLGQLHFREVRMVENEAMAGDGSSENGSARGGAVFSGGTGVLESTTLSKNRVRGGTAGNFALGAWPGADGSGGAIFNTGILRATNCTLALNIAAAGSASGLSFETNGGIASGGAIFNQLGSVELMNVTVASNVVVLGERSPPSRGANLANDTDGTMKLRNTIVAGGQGASNSWWGTISGGGIDGTHVVSNSWGIIVDGGFNMASDGSCAFASGTSFNFTDPKLGPLSSNGGFTETMALLSASPAIDFGSADGAPAVDQRGRPRPYGLGVDIGAVEIGPAAPMLIAGRNVLRFQGEVGVTYELWRSMDMNTWELAATIQPSASGVVEWPVTFDGDEVFLRLTVR